MKGEDETDDQTSEKKVETGDQPAEEDEEAEEDKEEKTEEDKKDAGEEKKKEDSTERDEEPEVGELPAATDIYALPARQEDAESQEE
eukprot:2654493-Amphidinium_carterae.1